MKKSVKGILTGNPGRKMLEIIEHDLKTSRK